MQRSNEIDTRIPTGFSAQQGEGVLGGKLAIEPTEVISSDSDMVLKVFIPESKKPVKKTKKKPAKKKGPGK